MFARIIMYCLAAISAVGLLLSTACHVLGWLRINPPGGQAVLFLGLGIFIIWPPLIFLANRTMPRGSGRGNMDHLFAELPKWARVAVMAVFIYAMLHFVLFLVMGSRYPRHEVPFSLEVRGFTGHFMMFYGWGLAGSVGLARLARKRGQCDLVSPSEPYAERRPAKDLESDREDAEQVFGYVKRPIGKTADYCWLLATAVWTLGWLGAVCLAAARVAQATDDGALAGLAIAVLMAGFGCLWVEHSVRCCLHHPRADDGAISAKHGEQSKDKVQSKNCPPPGPWPRRIFSGIVNWFATIIWCGGVMFWNFAVFLALLHSAMHGHVSFMLIMIPFSLIGVACLVGVFAAAAAVIESLGRILRRASSWL